MRIDPKHQARRVRGQDAGGWSALPALAARRGALGRLLATRASLTAALQRHGNTTVAVLRQHLAAATRDEAALIAHRHGQHLMVREVLLSVDGLPWVFAHTLANAAAQRLLRRAGKRPLASVLFADPRVRALGLHYAQLPPGHPLHRRALAARTLAAGHGRSVAPLPVRLAARRALFVQGAARLLVSEVFLLPPLR